MIPNYKEDMPVLHETLDTLASHPHALASYRIVLAMEAREQDSTSKAHTLIDLYSAKFLEITYTSHPPNIPGESAGKSSNLAWASRDIASRLAGDVERQERTVITVLDSDSSLAGDYFAAVAARFVDVKGKEDREKMMFVTPIVFDRNAKDVPMPVRIVDIFW